jgi:uncharacterized protein involved in type VI secretion and phage assembly
MNQGFYRAIVSENQDPEKLGRVRVEYPWFQGDSVERPSEWASVCLPYASSASGFWFLPEIGDEVLVYLQNGNLDHPIVFGALYSQKHLPPVADRAGDRNENNQNDLKLMRSRKGNVLCLDDSDSHSGFVLKDSENRRIEVLSQSDQVLLSDGKSTQVVLEKGKVRITNSQGDEIVLDSNGIKLKAQKIQIDGASSIELGSGASEALVKGKTFMSLFNAHTHTSSMPGSPTSPPVAPLTPAVLSTKVTTA